MKKKCIIIKIDGLPVMLCDVKELEPYEYIERDRECQDNLATFLNNLYNKERQLEKQIKELQHQIAILKGEED